MDADTETGGHGPHLLVEVHHMERIASHLLLHHDVVGLVAHHVVYRHLALSPALLRSHRHVVRLVHRILMALPCLVLSCVLRLLV